MLIIVFIVIVMLMAVLAIDYYLNLNNAQISPVNGPLGKQEKEPNLEQILCIAEASRDMNFCNGQGLGEFETSACIEGVKHVLLLSDKDMSVLDQISIMKGTFNAIAKNDINMCGNNTNCISIVSNDMSRCGEDSLCSDYYLVMTSIRDNDISGCDSIKSLKTRIECKSIISRDKGLCMEIK